MEGAWYTRVDLGGRGTQLGPFESAKDASDAFVAASAAEGLSVGGGGGRGASRKARRGSGMVVEATQAAPQQQHQQQKQSPVIMPSSTYRGVIRDLSPGGAQLWEAVFTSAEGREVSGGEYESEAEAARAYDALARMYNGEGAVCNFPLDPYTAWVPPEEVLSVGQIETRPGVSLTLEEVTGALAQERAVDVRVVPLAGRSDLADALVFATGRSVAHMRRMADMVARAQRKRALPSENGPVCVEGRDMDDWMLVDCGNIIVNIMDSEARECFDLEKMYETMEIGKDPYEGMTYEQWLEKNPVPEKWLARLERDERELAEAQRVKGGTARQLQQPSASANPNHFQRPVKGGARGGSKRAMGAK